jgi:hypothetical protein
MIDQNFDSMITVFHIVSSVFKHRFYDEKLLIIRLIVSFNVYHYSESECN